MNGLRFKVGDLARVAVITDADDADVINKFVEIVAIGEFNPDVGRVFDYDADYGDSEFLFTCMDYQLRKIDPPAEPASLTRTEDCEAEA